MDAKSLENIHIQTIHNWHYIYSPSHIRTDLQHYLSRRANLNPVCICLVCLNAGAVALCSAYPKSKKMPVLPYTVIYPLCLTAVKKLNAVFRRFMLNRSILT